MDQTIQPHPAISRPQHAPAYPRNNLSKPSDPWYIRMGLDSFLFSAVVHAVDVKDRDGASRVLTSIRYRYPWLRHIFADGGYAGKKLKSALAKIGKKKLQIVCQTDKAKSFELLPRRWVVKRTFAWLG